MDESNFCRISEDVSIHPSVRIVGFVNLYGCSIGADSFIGPFVEIQRDVTIGSRCKIQSHTFICSGVTIEDEVFVGHGVMFTNDRNPRSTNDEGKLLGPEDWKLEPTVVRRAASIGSGAVLLPGVTIGEGAVVGAGAVVTKDVEARRKVAGVPAQVLG